jgi:hydrogenase-4 component E
MNILTLQFLLEIVFGTIIFLQLTKKNFGAVLAYGLQSLAITAILFGSFFETSNLFLLFIALLVLFVKVILAPVFFIKLIKKHELTFSGNTYLNMPLTLLIIAILTFVAHSQKFTPLTGILQADQVLLPLAFSSMLLSLFLLINHKGALSQIIAVLSLENSIVAFTIFAGLEQSPTLQLGILFNIFIWLIIATVFVSIIYKHFGSLDITTMNNLKD